MGLVADIFKTSFTIRRCDIHSHNTRFSRNLLIDKIKLEISKDSFFFIRFQLVLTHSFRDFHLVIKIKN